MYLTVQRRTPEIKSNVNESRQEVSNNVVCATNKGSDQQTDQSLCCSLEYSMSDRSFGASKLKRRVHRFV